MDIKVPCFDLKLIIQTPLVEAQISAQYAKCMQIISMYANISQIRSLVDCDFRIIFDIARAQGYNTSVKNIRGILCKKI